MNRNLEKRLGTLTLDEMFALRQAIQDLLGERLQTRKNEIDRQLETLNRSTEKPGRASVTVKPKKSKKASGKGSRAA